MPRSVLLVVLAACCACAEAAGGEPGPGLVARLARGGLAPAIWIENAGHTLAAFANRARDVQTALRPPTAPRVAAGAPAPRPAQCTAPSPVTGE